MKIYLNKEMKQQKRNVLGWTEKGFGLKRKMFLGWKKDNTCTEKKRRSGAKEKKKGVPKQRTEKKKRKEEKGHQTSREKEEKTTEEDVEQRRTRSSRGGDERFLASICPSNLFRKNYVELVCVGFNF